MRFSCWSSWSTLCHVRKTGRSGLSASSRIYFSDLWIAEKKCLTMFRHSGASSVLVLINKKVTTLKSFLRSFSLGFLWHPHNPKSCTWGTAVGHFPMQVPSVVFLYAQIINWEFIIPTWAGGSWHRLHLSPTTTWDRSECTRKKNKLFYPEANLTDKSCSVTQKPSLQSLWSTQPIQTLMQLKFWSDLVWTQEYRFVTVLFIVH